MRPFESPLPVLSDLFVQGKGEVFTKAETLPTKDQCYQITSGYVALYEDTGKEHKKLVFLFGKNDIFPYPFQLYSRSDERVFRYCALDITQVKSIPLETLNTALATRQDVAVAAVRYVANILNMAFERIGDLEDLTVIDRLKKRLLFFADRFGIHGDGCVVIDIPFTHADIALSIGTTRETVNRMLNQLQKEKKISLVDRKIIIHRAHFLSEKVA